MVFCGVASVFCLCYSNPSMKLFCYLSKRESSPSPWAASRFILWLWGNLLEALLWFKWCTLWIFWGLLPISPSIYMLLLSRLLSSFSITWRRSGPGLTGEASSSKLSSRSSTSLKPDGLKNCVGLTSFCTSFYWMTLVLGDRICCSVWSLSLLAYP